jgi:hypothetical protein
MITLTQVRKELSLTGRDFDSLLTWLIQSIESVWDEMTNKHWASATYTETFSGTGEKYLFLGDFPVTSVVYVSVGETNVISIQNTSDNAVASVSVTSTGLVLVLNGATDATLLFATYTTVATLAAAITALGSGWSGEAYNSQGGWASSNLLPIMGRSCAKSSVDLSIPYEYLEDIEVDPLIGRILSYGFVPGTNNIRVKYIAGYTTATCPNWLKQTLIRQVAHWYMQASEKRWHVSSMQMADGGTISYNKDGKIDEINLLSDFKNMASMHRKINV